MGYTYIEPNHYINNEDYKNLCVCGADKSSYNEYCSTCTMAQRLKVLEELEDKAIILAIHSSAWAFKNYDIIMNRWIQYPEIDRLLECHYGD